jgi:signal transduction histidine kinase/ActR/RegA family two-component response regulator
VTATGSPEARVLLLALTARDSETTQAILAAAGITATVCASFGELLRELACGASALAVAEERMGFSDLARLAQRLREQPAWSDLPVLLLTRRGADSPTARSAVRELGNVTLLERPLRISALMSAVRTALRARGRQLQIRGHLEERERTAESLRLADQRKDEFLATLGHELRNPLSPLLAGVHLLRKLASEDPDMGRVIGMLERQVQHLVRLVGDLLEVSRITRGVIEVEREPIDLTALLNATVDTAQPILDAARHRLVIQLPPEPITITGDSVRLTQVFTNLLANAAKYTNAGGEISLELRREGDRALISVRDTGIGIAQEHLHSVFDMFVQVDRSSRSSQGGLGIGLTLVRSLVSMHGGTVEARSAGPGEGSEFVVTLPIASVAEIAPSAALVPDGPPRRVLVVDDNRDAANTLGALLRMLGNSVAVAHSGESALAALPTFEPELILLDLGMPHMNGFEVARRIRASARHSDVRLIALTGWGQAADVERSRRAGFDQHVVKPLDIERLRDLLRAPDEPAEARA